ncbi:unnamed protein product [Cuscuta campestris]|uniref:F-box associated beta-propeller type 3 domain-containing protein n=1 Tax=Cuscuta campestris TaxID=132261 RepID=A0A484K9E0_9ASTE|nr:unnamed protein product [Cuscuta campestris]
MLGTEPLPTLSRAIYIIQQIETQRNVTRNIPESGAFFANDEGGRMSSLKDRREDKRFKTGDQKYCKHCKSEGHLYEQCFERIGYPDWYKGKKNKKFGNTKLATHVNLSERMEESSLESPFELNGNQNHKQQIDQELVSVICQEVMRMFKGKTGQGEFHEANMASTSFSGPAASPNLLTCRLHSRAEVYSLSSCSWKVVECGLLVGMSLDSQTVTANGSMFWVGSKRRVNGYGGTRSDLKIVSFNIATEVFTLIPMPSHSFSFYRLAVFEKKLCIIAAPSYSPRSGSKIRWWVMEEERLNWSKKYISCPLSCPLSPLAVWKNEMVCYLDGSPSATESAGVNEEPSAALLNLATGGYRLFALPECFHAFDHVESLVPVRGNKYSCTCTF